MEIWLESELRKRINHPPLLGLILAGGKSTRMGRDKALLAHPSGKSVVAHLRGILPVPEVYISVNDQQKGLFTESILDVYPSTGPMGGLLSAMELHPEVAWLVVAVDMPLLTAETLVFLVNHRNHNKKATCFLRQDNFPEPLVTIYEPSSYQELSLLFQLDKRSLRQWLLQADIEQIRPPKSQELRSFDTPQSYQQ